MKTKVVYVVVSSENDIYLEQFYISIKSLRKNSPNTHVILLTDNLSHKSFIGFRKEIIDEADELITISLDQNLSAQYRSRLLKTSIREYISGDFLFIDCDTIILKDLSAIDECPYDIAACIDSHSSFEFNPYRNMIIQHGNLIDCKYHNDINYYNSGVIFVKDSKIANRFFKLWNSLWKEGIKKGVKMDQPSFNKTNYMLSFPIKELSHLWNCELKHGLKYLNSAIILHYLCTNINRHQELQPFIMNDREILLKIKSNHNIPNQILECFDDVFAGFNSPTQIISGEDMEFHNSLTFKILKNLFNKKLDNMLFYLYYKFIKLKNKLFSN